LINHLAVLTAQQQKNQVSDLEVISRLQTASAVVLLYKSLGGNWEEDAPKFEENKTEWW
jgi:outer membrane protein TolC